MLSLTVRLWIQIVQQRNAQVELEDQRRQAQDIAQSKKQLQAEIEDLKDRLEAETLSKNEETSAYITFLSVDQVFER